MANTNSSFVTRFRQAMMDKGCSQGDIAESLGVSQKSVSAWATGKAVPRYETMGRLAEYLGVPATELSGYRNPSDKKTYHTTERYERFDSGKVERTMLAEYIKYLSNDSVRVLFEVARRLMNLEMEDEQE